MNHVFKQFRDGRDRKPFTLSWWAQFLSLSPSTIGTWRYRGLIRDYSPGAVMGRAAQDWAKCGHPFVERCKACGGIDWYRSGRYKRCRPCTRRLKRESRELKKKISKTLGEQGP